MSEDEDRSIVSASSDVLGIESSATSFSGRGDLRPPLPPPFEARDRGQDPGSETEPTSRAVPTPPDEADNTPYNGDSELSEELSAWLALAWPKVRTEEDRRKIIRVLLDAQAELFSLATNILKGEEEKE